MIVVIVQHRCRDYDAWRPVFDEHGATRRAHGCISERVYRDASDPNDVAVVMEWPSREAAEGFMADPTLATAMTRGGVIGQPRASFAQPVPVAAR